MNAQRAIQEYLVFELPVNGFLDGVPQFSPTLNPTQLALKALIAAAHVEEDGECGVNGYLNKNLNNGADRAALYAAVTGPQWTAYIKIQKKMIKKLRIAAAEDARDLFSEEYLSKADWASMDHVGIKAAFTAIDETYAYPTNYGNHP